MRYLLLIYGKTTDWDDIPPDRAAEIMGAYGAYTAQLKAAGVHVSDDELQPVAASKTLRGPRGAKVADGPYAETKESLGGYYLIDAPSEEDAVRWAQLCPCFLHGGEIELRPVMAMKTSDKVRLTAR